MTQSEELTRGLEAVAAKDSAPFRQHAFAYLARHDPRVRLARAVHGALPKALRHGLIQAYGWASAARTAPPRGPAPVAAAGRYRNERRQFDRLARDADVGIEAVDLEAGPAAWLSALTLLGDAEARRVMAVATDHDDFLVACRSAETVGRWLQLRGRLPASTRAVLVSSDTNPYAVALMAAAREAGLKVAYVNHGHLPEGPPPLDVDLAILDGEALLDVYRRAGPVSAEVVFRGSEGSYRPLHLEGLKPGLKVGVFASLLVDWPTLERTIEQVREATEASSVLLRLHPNQTIRDPDWASHVSLRLEDRVSDGGRSILNDAEACDLVVAGNSSCHLSLLKYGTPTLQVPDLDLVPHDFYRFLQDHVVPWEEDASAVSLDRVRGFFEDGWKARFARYDAGYPDTDGEGARRAAEALRQLAGLS
ncbi:MAG: hypothetical protein GY898_25730 [Proteobacteria bacterium]|nr:hypothetical protein [Pseudomonadota bacterium]